MTDERRPDEPIDDLENGPDGESGAPSSALLHDASPADESSASENERFADDESDAEADDEARALYETIPIVPRKLPSAASFFGEPRPPKHSAHVEPAPSATWQDPTTTGVFDRPRLAGAPRAPSTAENLTAQEPPQPPVHRQTFVPIVSTPEPASVPGHGSAPQPAPMFDATHEPDAGVDPDSPPEVGPVVAPDTAVDESSIPGRPSSSTHPLALDLSALRGALPDEAFQQGAPNNTALRTDAARKADADRVLRPDTESTAAAQAGAESAGAESAGAGWPRLTIGIPSPAQTRLDTGTLPAHDQPGETPTAAFGAVFGSTPTAPIPHPTAASFTELISVRAEEAPETAEPASFDWSSLPLPPVEPLETTAPDASAADALAAGDPTFTAPLGVLGDRGSSESGPARDEVTSPTADQPQSASPESTDSRSTGPEVVPEAESDSALVELPAAPWSLTGDLSSEIPAVDEPASTFAVAPGEQLPEAPAPDQPPIARPDLRFDPPTTSVDPVVALFGPALVPELVQPESVQPESVALPEPDENPNRDSSWADLPRAPIPSAFADPSDVPTQAYSPPAAGAEQSAPRRPAAADEHCEPDDPAPTQAFLLPDDDPMPTRTLRSTSPETPAPTAPANAPGAWFEPVSKSTPRSGASGFGPGGYTSLPRERRRVIALGVLVAFIIVLVVLFLVGRALVSRDSASAATTAPNTTSATPASTPKSTPKPTPTPSSTVAAGPAAPGIRLWSALQGGECLNGFQNAWQQTYDVTNCTTAHTAQMTLKGVLPIAAGAAAYPGDASLQNQVGLVCASSQAISLSAAQAYTGIEVSESYPTSDQWAAGDRTYYCFASRSGGQTLTTSIAAA